MKDAPAASSGSDVGVPKTTRGTSSLEAPTTQETVPVPRVGAPDPAGDALGAEAGDNLEAVSKATVEEAAARDAEARERTDALLHRNRAEAVPPITHADQNVLGNAAPNDEPIASGEPDSKE